VGLRENLQLKEVLDQLRSGGEKKKREEQKKFPVSRSEEVGSSSGPIIHRAEVVDCEPELKKQVPEKSKRLLTLIRMTKDEKGLAFFKGLLL
jgi:hypothetical protein